jgi:hypothetical protein
MILTICFPVISLISAVFPVWSHASSSLAGICLQVSQDYESTRMTNGDLKKDILIKKGKVRPKTGHEGPEGRRSIVLLFV